MFRGIISGLFWGSLIAFATLIVLAMAPNLADRKLTEPSGASKILDKEPVTDAREFATQSAEKSPIRVEPAHFPSVSSAPPKEPLLQQTSALPTSGNKTPFVAQMKDPSSSVERQAVVMQAPLPRESTFTSPADVIEIDLPRPSAMAQIPAIAPPLVGQLSPQTPQAQRDKVERIVPAQPSPPPSPTPAPLSAQASSDTPTLLTNALERNAISFDNPMGLPVMSIVVIDDDRSSPIALPIQLTIALRADSTDASDRAKSYYDFRNYEIALIPNTSLSERDIATDIAAMPLAASIIDDAARSLTLSSDDNSAEIEVIARSGHGLLLSANGDARAEQVARDNEIPAVRLFRDIDGQGQQTAAVIRFLDHSAQRARLQDGVVVLLRNQPSTISALSTWSLGERAATTAFAPLSYFLR